MTDARFAARLVTCPGCGGDSVYAATNPHRPFCSARCRNIDLGAWGSEAYRVAPAPASHGAEGLQDDDEAAVP